MGSGAGQSKRLQASASTSDALPRLQSDKWRDFITGNRVANTSIARYYLGQPGDDLGSGRPMFNSDEVGRILTEVLRDAIAVGAIRFQKSVVVTRFTVLARARPSAIPNILGETLTLEYEHDDGIKSAVPISEAYHRFPFETMRDIENDLEMLHTAVLKTQPYARAGLY